MKFTLTLLTICLCLTAERAQCQERAKAMDSFRSELWQREFRKEEKKREGPKFQGGGKDTSRPGSKSTDFDSDDHTGSRNLPLPGQAQLDQLREETPIAEWQIDKVVKSNYQSAAVSFRGRATAWQLSRSGTDSTAPAPSQMSEGPTMTTYLVGFMACIVVCGALLTGRE